MRKVIFQNMITLDGFFEGAKRGEIDWHMVDDEFNIYANEVLESLDTLLFGRVTYEMMAFYWPSAEGLRDDPITAANMNKLEKVVFSKTLKKADWNNSHLVKGDLVEEVKRLKALPGKNMAIFGSSDISVPLAKAGLIDEYRLFINPMFLGSGKTILQGLNMRIKLKLIQTRHFLNGVVLLCYKPE